MLKNNLNHQQVPNKNVNLIYTVFFTSSVKCLFIRQVFPSRPHNPSPGKRQKILSHRKSHPALLRHLARATVQKAVHHARAANQTKNQLLRHLRPARRHRRAPPRAPRRLGVRLRSPARPPGLPAPPHLALPQPAVPPLRLRRHVRGAAVFREESQQLRRGDAERAGRAGLRVLRHAVCESGAGKGEEVQLRREGQAAGAACGDHGAVGERESGQVVCGGV